MSIYAILGIIAALLALAVWSRRAGAAAERSKEALERLAARNIADEIDNDVGVLPKGAAREELKKWSSPKS